jgi:hypothetical protein
MQEGSSQYPTAININTDHTPVQWPSSPPMLSANEFGDIETRRVTFDRPNPSVDGRSSPTHSMSATSEGPLRDLLALRRGSSELGLSRYESGRSSPTSSLESGPSRFMRINPTGNPMSPEQLAPVTPTALRRRQSLSEDVAQFKSVLASRRGSISNINVASPVQRSNDFDGNFE